MAEQIRQANSAECEGPANNEFQVIPEFLSNPCFEFGRTLGTKPAQTTRNRKLNPTQPGENEMSRTAKRTRSLVITIIAIAVTNIAISYASGIPILPDSPKPKSGIPILPDSPKPKSGIPILPDSPKPKSGIPILPDSPKP